MGMFDSFYDPSGVEWQTKALACRLDRFEIGDEVPGPPCDYQMEVIGGRGQGFEWSFVTIRDGRVAEIPAPRDPLLALREYSDGWKPAEKRSTYGHH